MTLPLSYPSLKCVLEHLEAVKRAHIIARAPGLQKIDKLIPLCLMNLDIGKRKLFINKLWITCDKDRVEYEMIWNKFSRQISESLEDKIKKLARFHICGRSNIYVNRLNWHDNLPPGFLPVDLKFRVNSLETGSDFETAILFIDPQSFPLKTVFTIPEASTLFDNQVVKLAETITLILVNHRNVTVEDLKKLENKTVMIKSFWDFRIDIIPLIKYHIETKKDICTTFEISTGDKNCFSEMLREFEQAFGEYRNDLDFNERFLPGYSRFSIPINDETKIHVYTTRETTSVFRDIIVKPVSEVLAL
ncbi:hypothetical protein GCK72_007871 [Caenorhabditis remanei]|uniref:DUF38 domain-containing protein n=1 Tax=Caenorhabditis remanei TaxID=31234 RepID=A0A6A5HL97_CAERE|nr:hypothetical protein GCK72_007871 [Caenorhabditis remanei]KAF1767911.1 hypothetical protein GCK72_007871 [Caenorhabditis remanei]